MSFTPSFDQLRAQYARNAQSLATIVAAAKRSRKPTFRGNTVEAWEAMQARCARLAVAPDADLVAAQQALANAFSR